MNWWIWVGGEFAGFCFSCLSSYDRCLWSIYFAPFFRSRWFYMIRHFVIGLGYGGRWSHCLVCCGISLRRFMFCSYPYEWWLWRIYFAPFLGEVVPTWWGTMWLDCAMVDWWSRCVTCWVYCGCGSWFSCMLWICTCFLGLAGCGLSFCCLGSPGGT